jgi:trans-aconitate methyltransferase
MLPRTPEPELMDTSDQAEAYDAADFSEASRLFLASVEAHVGDPEPGACWVDLGCGPADIPLTLLQRWPGVRIEALDGAEAMLARARLRRQTSPPDVARRLTLHHTLLPLDAGAGPWQADAVLSNSLLHHLHDPAVFWRTVRQVGRPGAAVVVMDLRRPDSEAEVDSLVTRYAADAPEVLRQDFRASLHAAWRADEIAAQLAAMGWSGWSITLPSDRHVQIAGHLPAA